MARLFSITNILIVCIFITIIILVLNYNNYDTFAGTIRKPLVGVARLETTYYPPAQAGQGSTIVVQDDNFTQPTDYNSNPTAVTGGFPPSPDAVGYEIYDAATGGNLIGKVVSYRMGTSNYGSIYRSIFLTLDKDVQFSESQKVYYQPPPSTPVCPPPTKCPTCPTQSSQQMGSSSCRTDSRGLCVGLSFDYVDD